MTIKPSEPVNSRRNFSRISRDICMSTAMPGYDDIPNIRLVGYWTHARHKFVQALKAAQSEVKSPYYNPGRTGVLQKTVYH
jgi:hypothetical protein